MKKLKFASVNIPMFVYSSIMDFYLLQTRNSRTLILTAKLNVTGNNMTKRFFLCFVFVLLYLFMNILYGGGVTFHLKDTYSAVYFL